MLRLVLAAHLFLAAAVAVAQPPPVAAVRAGDSLAVADGKFADVKVDVPPGASVVWRFYPPPLQRAADLPPGRAIFAGERGKTYVVTAVVIDFGKKTVSDVEFEVKFGGKADPAPDDDKKDTPKPKPQPTGTLYLVVVEETSNRSPETARTLSDPVWWDTLKARDVLWRHYDKDSPDALRLGYLTHANKVGLPAALVLDRAGAVLDAKRLTTTAELDAMLKGVGR